MNEPQIRCYKCNIPRPEGLPMGWDCINKCNIDDKSVTMRFPCDLLIECTKEDKSACSYHIKGRQ